MGQNVKGRSELCPLPPGPLKEIPRHMKPRTIMAVGLTFMLTTTGLAFYLIQPIIWGILPDPEPKVYTPHSAIAIDGDANFSATALLEGWPGNGSPENPFIIDGFEIDLGSEEGHCIFINNTRVSFIISNCNLTGATLAAAPAVKFVPPLRELPRSILNVGSGIHLYNVSNGEIVSNTCNNNSIGIDLFYADSNIVSSNTCDNNTLSGINLWDSDSNTVANNTCSSNTESGIYLWQSDSNTVEYNTVATTVGGIWLSASDSNTIVSNTCNENGCSGIYLWASHASTVANNTCTSSEYGISLDSSDWNTVANNNCSNNTESGIYLWASNSNTVATNICNANRIGIYLSYGCLASNIIADNTFLGNTEHDIFEEYIIEEDGTEEFDPIGFLFVGFTGVMVLGAAWRMVKLSRPESKGE